MIELTDRAETHLRATRRVSVPLSELALALGADEARVRRALEPDDRFVVLGPTAIPELVPLPDTDRDAYAAAFRAAGLGSSATVALTAPPVDEEPSVDAMLRRTVARVLARSADADLAAAAERIRRAVRATKGSDGRGRSTTPPPDPSAAPPAPPRRPPPSLRRPPYPGSRRG